MTVEQALIETVELLKNINVPVALIEQIGFPINGAISNIQLCLDAFEQERRNKAEPVQDDHVEVEIEEVDPEAAAE